MNNLPKTAILTIALLACFLYNSVTADAAPLTKKPTAWYKVEMVVFSQLTYGEMQNEVWPALPPFTLPQSVYTLIPPQVFAAQQGANALTFPLMTNQDFNLQKEAMHISHNPNYKIVGHVAWLQPITIKHQIIPTYIQASNGQTSLDALLTISKKHYIQLNMQGIASIQDNGFSKAWLKKNNIDDNDIIRFKVDRSIRMKSNELDYIDTPFIGVLIEITAYKGNPNQPTN